MFPIQMKWCVILTEDVLFPTTPRNHIDQTKFVCVCVWVGSAGGCDDGGWSESAL